MKVIFVFLSRLKWKYVKIMEVQEITMEVQEESVTFLLYCLGLMDYRIGGRLFPTHTLFLI